VSETFNDDLAAYILHGSNYAKAVYEIIEGNRGRKSRAGSVYICRCHVHKILVQYRVVQ